VREWVSRYFTNTVWDILSSRQRFRLKLRDTHRAVPVSSKNLSFHFSHCINQGSRAICTGFGVKDGCSWIVAGDIVQVKRVMSD
jgi:hypothetical protein